MPRRKRKDRTGKAQLAVWIPKETKARLKRFAKAHKETVAGAVDWCLRDAIENQEKAEAMR